MGRLLNKKSKVDKGEGLWLLSFSDLCMILIAFFILMLSSATLDQKKMDQIQSAWGENEQKKTDLQILQSALEKEILRQKLQDKATVSFDMDGLSIEFANQLLFSAGSAEANPQFYDVVATIMELISHTPDRYHLIFEGHTDDLPTAATGKYPSNWALSGARGITLLEAFEKRGVSPFRMSVTAFAHTRPKSPINKIQDPDALAQARASNRRVVIRIKP
jgi:chemotaxis protein MotB